MLFQPIKLRELEIRNRVFMAPMCQYSAVDGVANDWHLSHYSERAKGGTGLVVIEATAVRPEGRISPGDLGLWNAEQETSLARVVRSIHAAEAKAAIQIAHAGRKASTSVPWLGTGPLKPENGAWQTLAPSAVAFADSYAVPREMTRSDIDSVVSSFADAAVRAVRAGFDCIEIHAAHGYLLHEFLSPLSNTRGDEYGSSEAGRFRIVERVVEAVRHKIPDDMPLLIRISASDWVEGGWDPEASIRLLRGLADKGVDHVDVSSGGLVPYAKISPSPLYQVDFAAKIKASTPLTVSAVGLITELDQMNRILAEGKADAISLGRLLLREPYWVNRNCPPESRQIPPQYKSGFPIASSS